MVRRGAEEPADLLSQVKADGHRFKNGRRLFPGPLVINQCWNLSVGVELFISIGVLDAVADVDLMQFKRKAGFLNHDQSAAAVCRPPGVKINHRMFTFLRARR